MKKLISAVLCAGVMVGSFGGLGVDPVRAQSAWQIESTAEKLVRRFWLERYNMRLKQEHVNYVLFMAKNYCRSRERGATEDQWWKTVSGLIEKESGSDADLADLLRRLTITGKVAGFTFYCPEYK